MRLPTAYQTPLPPIKFLELGGKLGKEQLDSAPSRRASRGFVARAFALAGVTGLLCTVAYPSTFALSDPGSLSNTVQTQMLAANSTPPMSSAVDEIGAVEIKDAPPISGIVPEKDQLVGMDELPDTELRFPFDQTMPLTDGFGYRSAPVAQFHDAQDIAAANGTPIFVIGDGEVLESGWSNDGCGFSLKVQHKVDGQDLTSRYCHMEADSHSWQVGDRVEISDEAGRVGNTGMSFGAHLHLALRLNGEPIDPLPFIDASTK